MKLHPSLTTVTPFTKTPAMFLFIALPITTFVIGMKFGYKYGISEAEIIHIKEDLSKIDEVVATPQASITPSATIIDEIQERQLYTKGFDVRGDLEVYSNYNLSYYSSEEADIERYVKVKTGPNESSFRETNKVVIGKDIEINDLI